MKINTPLGIIIGLAILIFLNLVATLLFFRIDLTENKLYSLTPVTKNILKKIDDKLIIKAYFSGQIPPPHNNVARFTRDLLDEYRVFGGNKIEYKFLDPSQDPKIEDEAIRYGIQPMQLQAIEKDQVSLKKVYMGLLLIFEDKTEIIPFLQSGKDLEYLLTSLLKKLTIEEVQRIGYATGHSEADLYTECRNLQSSIIGQYRFQPLSLPSARGELPSDMKTLLILAPKDTFDTVSLTQIDPFMMYGGRLALCLDQYDADISTQQAIPIHSGLEQLAEKYGITINKDLVADKQCGTVGIMRNMGFFQVETPVEYPYIPVITNFNRDNLIGADLEVAAMVFASSVDTNGQNPKAEYKSIISTTENAQRMTEPFDLDPFTENVPDFNAGPITLAFSASGVFPSFFADNPPTDFETSRPFKTESDSTKLVVFGDGNFLTDQFQQDPSNLVLFLNVIDWLTSKEGEGLISIRSRDVASRPLKELKYSENIVWKIINIALTPILIILYGIYRWIVRRARKKQSLNV